MKTRSRMLAALLSLAMVFVYMPFMVYADGDQNDLETLKAAMDTAEIEMNTAREEMETAEGVMDTALGVYNAKKTVEGQKKTAYENAKTATETAASNITAAISDIRTEKQTDYDNALAAYNAAVTEYNNAVSALQTAQTEKENAENAKTDLENELSGLTAELNTKEGQIPGLETEIQNAQTAVDQKNAQWEQEKLDAAADEQAAQTAYDNAGRSFINEKINSINGTDLETMLAACKTYTTALKKTSTGPDGTQYTTIGQIASLDSFDQLVTDACSYENLKQDIAYIREANEIRALPAHNAAALKVSYQLMGTAIISNTMSVYATGHNLTGNSWTFWNSGNSMTSGENLAYSSATPAAGWDPYHGWYYEERAVWLKDPNGKTPVTSAEVNQVLQESLQTSHPYTLPTIFCQTVDDLVDDINQSLQTGHYLGLIKSDYKATGVAYVDGRKYGFRNYGSSRYPCVAAQEFNGDTRTSVSVDVFEQELDECFASYETNLNNAKAAVAALANEPAYLTEAKAALATKQSELTVLNNRIDELENTLIPEKQVEISDAQGVIEIKTTAYNNALNVKSEKETEKNNKQTALTAAEQAKDKAALIDVNDPDSYADYPEIVSLVNIRDGKAADEENARIAYENAMTETSVAETDYNIAKTDYENMVTAYNGKVTAYNDAKEAYLTAHRQAGAHTWDAGEVKTQATCETAGEMSFTCTICGDTKTEPIEAKTHAWGDWTSISNSQHQRVCANDASHVETAAHAWKEDKVTTEPTCTEAGVKTYICTVCGAEKTETIDALTHDWGVWTSISDEQHQRVCSHDPSHKQTEAHTWDEGVETTPATYTAEGVKTYTCIACRATKTESIPKKTKEAGSDPTQKAKDGTLTGAGASEACADKAITSATSEEGPSGTKFGTLSLKSVKQGKTNIVLTWNKNDNADRYAVYGNACGKGNKMQLLSKNVKNNTFNVKKIGKALAKGKYYKFIVVALDKNNNVVSTSKVVHVATNGGKVGNDKSVTVSKSVIKKAKALKKGKSLKLKAKAVAQSKKLKVKNHRAVSYESSDTNIATVSKKGVVKAKKKGKCYIYAYAQNGVFKKIKVTVK